MALVFYRQCGLKKITGDSTLTQLAWIPEKYAKVGSYLNIRTNDNWDNHWRVTSRGENRLSEKQLPDHNKAVRSHREATGDNTPKVK